MITRHLNLECLVRTYSIDQKKLSGLETSSCIFLVFSKKHCIHYIVVLLFTDLDFRQNQFHHYKDIIDDVKKNNTGLIAVTLSKKNLQLHLFFFLHLSDTVSKLLKPLSIPGISLLPRNSW